MTNPVVIAASSKHTATFIFLHGLGDTGHGWANAIAAVRASHCKVICPTAASRPVKINNGFSMPAWFNLLSLDPQGQEDEEGIVQAKDLIHGMIKSEISGGIPANRIMIGGFSQGGALALYSALTFPQRLAGVVALSCWLPLHKSFPSGVKSNDVPIFQCHGDCDPVVPYKWGQMTSTLLKSFMVNPEFKSYQGMMHSSCEEEMQDMKTFVQKHIGLPH